MVTLGGIAGTSLGKLDKGSGQDDMVREILKLWAEVKQHNTLPLEDDMKIEDVKADFIRAYGMDKERLVVQLARLIAQNGAVVSEIVEVEAGLSLAMNRYWAVVAT